MSNTLGTKRLGTVLALIVAFAIALAMIVTPAAHAVDTVGNIKSGQSAPDYKLTIHKHATPVNGTQSADGHELTGGQAPTTEALVAKFEIRKVNNVDLSSNTGWDALKTLDAKDLETNKATKTTLVAEVTTTNGVAEQVLDKTPAVYLVTETEKPAGVSAEVAPFLVTVPFPSAQAAGGWIYDVHVYPKNVKDGEVTKKVAADTPTTKKGDDIKWEMSLPIPQGATDFASFVVKDRLHSKLSVQSSVLTIEGVTGADLVPADYTASTLSASDRFLTVTFNATGLAKLNANKGKNIKWTLVTTLAGDAADDTIINQKPARTWTFVPDDGGNTPPGGGDTPPSDEDTPPNPPADTPAAYFGNYKFKKVEAGHENNVLSGATFEVYTKDKATKLATVTSDENGVVNIKGLYIGSTTDSVTAKKFFIKETQAPVGFVLPANPWTEITVSSTKSLTGALQFGDNVPNTKATGPNLPLTGASGKLLMTLGGAAIVLFAAGTVLVTRRRQA